MSLKLNIPESIADDLRCFECNELLSCGPVFLIHGTSDAICGRCSLQPNEPLKNVPSTSSSGIQNKSRNLQYETMAKLFSFPCPYPDCLEQMAFSEGEPNRHEYECKFRLFQECPIVETGSCEWTGARCDLIKHCTKKHPEQLYSENTCVLRLSELKNILVTAFNLLFLIQFKVCESPNRLFHSVRMFGDFNLVDNFSYFIKVKGNSSEFTLDGSVLPCKNMILQESSGNCISLENMLEILGGKYKDLMLIIKIRPSYKYCLNCFENINHMIRSKFCDECLETMEKCGYNEQSCSFVDAISIKCKKHLAFFCMYQTKCNLCQVTFNTGSLIEHLVSSDSLHEVITSEYNLFVSIKSSNNLTNSYILFSHHNEIGTVIGQYNLCKSNFKLWLYTPLASHELNEFKCSIELKDPQTETTKILTPKIQYDKLFDWSINEIVKKFKEIEVKINIDKI